jgi:hypothetical protein
VKPIIVVQCLFVINEVKVKHIKVRQHTADHDGGALCFIFKKAGE